MSQCLARFLSFMFHPLFFSLIMPFFIEYRHTQNGVYALKWFIFTSAFIFFGAFLILFGVWKKVFSDFDISRREERYKFYLILLFLAFSYFMTTIAFKGTLFPLSIIGYGIIIGIFAFDALNYFMKASVHTAVVTAFVLSMGILYGFWVAVLIFWLIPIIVWARIKIKKHTPLEIIAGAFLGIFITLFTLFLGKVLHS